MNCCTTKKLCQRCEERYWAEPETRLKRNVKADVDRAKDMMSAMKMEADPLRLRDLGRN